jgi:hypothetical protein
VGAAFAWWHFVGIDFALGHPFPPNDGMVGALHQGMSSRDVVNTLGQPCRRLTFGGTNPTYDLLYPRAETNTLLIVSFPFVFGFDDLSGTHYSAATGTIENWAILVPQNRGQPDGDGLPKRRWVSLL